MGSQVLGMGSLVCEPGTSYSDQPTLDDITIHSAMANFDKAWRICPDCMEAHLGKGLLLQKLNQLEQAQSELKKATALDEKNFDAHFALGQLHEDLHNLPEAINSYKRASDIQKKDIRPHIALARILDDMGFDTLADEQRKIIKRLRRQNEK